MSSNGKMPEALFESRLTALTRLSQGKVRDIYEIDADHLLIVTTDRISAFDVILPDPIPGKGEVLTELSNFWLDKTSDIIANHLVALRLEDVISDPVERETIASRATVVRRLNPLPIEAVVRGYLIGSGWKDYQSTGKVCDIQLPTGLPAQTEEMIGGELARRVRDLSLKI
jgi:phosphoribosylaminoimidazole-succinocarboxamide synthase